MEKIDAKNQKIGYGYDNAGRLIEIRYYATAGDTAPQKTVNFTYDAMGNLTGYADGVTSAVYGYDETYRKVTEAVDYGDFSLTNTFTYFNDGRKKTFTGPDNVTYEYQYDTGGRLAGVQIPNVGFVTIGEYTWNRPTQVTLPGGTVREYEYDPLMRIKRITSRDPGSNVLLNYLYSHDKMDNIIEKSTEHGDYGYQYDDLYRLTDADNPPVQNDETYTYDTVGNRLTSVGTTGNWTYNQNNELGGYDAVSFEYDANGNMVKKTVGTAVTSYVYNIENRLVEVWNGEAGTGSLTASYYYDPFGRRLWKEVGGVRTHFHYADEGLIGEYDAVGDEIKTYGYKPGSTWTTDLLFMKEGGQYYFYHNDHLGTPQKMTAVNGAVVWSAKYGSFGEAMVEVGVVENHLRFPGQYYDAETGLHYNLLRYFDTDVGRYLKEDPFGILGGINLFAYTANNPINYSDNFALYYKGWWFRKPYFENLNIEYTGITKPEDIEDKNPRKIKLAYLHFKASATVGFTVYCKEYDCKDKEVRHWWVHKDWTDEFPVNISVKLKIISIKYLDTLIIAYKLGKAILKARKYYNSKLAQLAMNPVTYCYIFPSG